MALTPKPLAASALPKAVAQAVKIAADPGGHELASDTIPQSWHLIGRIQKDDAKADTFAATVVQELQKTGIKGHQVKANIGGRARDPRLLPGRSGGLRTKRVRLHRGIRRREARYLPERATRHGGRIRLRGSVRDVGRPKASCT